MMTAIPLVNEVRKILAPPTPAARILADMHLHAVLPRIGDLVRLDDEAGAIARDMDVTIAFMVRGGPRVFLAFDRGKVTASRTGSCDVLLFFPSCELLNRMFAGEKVTPIPLKGIHHFKALQKFTKLSDLLTKYLKPTPEAMKDKTFRAKHVEMSLLVGLAACRSVAELDRGARRAADGLHDGTLLYSVGRGGPEAHIVITHGVIDARPGPVADPSTTVEIRDVDLAVDVIAGRVDTFAASGVCDLRLGGDLHLADGFNQLFDRVGFYLK
jgi:hypothetical protein